MSSGQTHKYIYNQPAFQEFFLGFDIHKELKSLTQRGALKRVRTTEQSREEELLVPARPGKRGWEEASPDANTVIVLQPRHQFIFTDSSGGAAPPPLSLRLDHVAHAAL